MKYKFFPARALVAAGVTCFAVSAIRPAAAEDLAFFAIDPTPNFPDLTWHGISLVGAYDVSAQYESAGAPYAGATYSSAGIISPMNRKPMWLVAPNQSFQSYIGLKVDEPITDQTHFVARFEVGFNPTTFEISDTLRSMQRANGIPLAQQNFNGDGPRAGQIFNGDAWVGLQDSVLGTLRYGRNLSVSTDMVILYDPLVSYGFSLLGNIGLVAGQGSPETIRVDNSVKYLNNFGPFRVELMYGNPNTNVDQFFQGSIGYVQPNFSVDAFGGYATDMTFSSALAGPTNFGSKFLGARVYDTSAVGLFGKYVFPLGPNGLTDLTEPRFTMSVGYNRLDFTNPDDGGIGIGHTTIGGYRLGPRYATNGSAATGIVDYAFTGGDRVIDATFITGKYQFNPVLSAAAAYQRYDQNTYGRGVNSIPGIVAPAFSRNKCSTAQYINCAGTYQVLSFRVDYDWTKNIRLYAGVAYSAVSGGFAFSYLKRSEWAPTAGVRLIW